MTQRDWRAPARTLGVFLDGDGMQALSEQGEPLRDDSFVLLFNAGAEAVVFTLPPRRFGRRWVLEVSTAEPDEDGMSFPARGLLALEGRSVAVLRRAA